MNVAALDDDQELGGTVVGVRRVHAGSISLHMTPYACRTHPHGFMKPIDIATPRSNNAGKLLTYARFSWPPFPTPATGFALAASLKSNLKYSSALPKLLRAVKRSTVDKASLTSLNCAVVYVGLGRPVVEFDPRATFRGRAEVIDSIANEAAMTGSMIDDQGTSDTMSNRIVFAAMAGNRTVSYKIGSTMITRLE